jgi:hypothetical protein
MILPPAAAAWMFGPITKTAVGLVRRWPYDPDSGSIPGLPLKAVRKHLLASEVALRGLDRHAPD